MKYVPILKWKAGEYQAIRKLSPPIVSEIRPLFEITPPDFDFEKRQDKKTLEEHLGDFSKKYIKNCNRLVSFLDTRLLPSNSKMNDGRLPLEFLLAELAKHEVIAIPVICLDDDSTMLAFVRENNQYGVCIRIQLQQIMSPNIETDLTRVIDRLGVDPESVDLVFDLRKPSSFEPIEAFTSMLEACIQKIPSIRSWRSFVVSSCSFPDRMAEVTEGIELRDRKEWIAYKLLISNIDIGRPIVFSDYTISPPIAEYERIDHTKTTKKCNIKYTIDDKWVLLRGKMNSRQKKYMKEFHTLAENLVNSGYFLGENFSEADAFIKRCALEKDDAYDETVNTSSGNLTNWVEVGVNHHITKVIDDFSKIAAS